MNKKEMNSLVIVSEVYEGVTPTPHFPTTIDYEGCHVEFDDIYYDQLETIPDQLRKLEKSRKGIVIIDGGQRFGITVKTDLHGGVVISFRACPTSFPGKLVLEGSFQFDGEHTAQTIENMVSLLIAGQTLRIEQRRVRNS